MQINIQKFTKIAETAKAKTNNKRWQSAIDKAVAGVVSGWWVITELADCYAITTETGKTYFANGSCQCEAYRRNQPCKHRCCARLLDIYNEETARKAVSPAPRVVRSIERDIVTKRRVRVTRCNDRVI